jgi:hypothetical protein
MLVGQVSTIVVVTEQGVKHAMPVLRMAQPLLQVLIIVDMGSSVKDSRKKYFKILINFLMQRVKNELALHYVAVIFSSYTRFRLKTVYVA